MQAGNIPGCKLNVGDFSKRCWLSALVDKRTQLIFTCSKWSIETLEKGVNEMCLKLTTKTPECRHWRRSSFFIVNFEHISHLFDRVYTVDFEQVNDSDYRLLIKTSQEYCNCFVYSIRNQLFTIGPSRCEQP